ncbi:MAG TPA: DUF1778 domain-containing protein [Pyrinomonadaceae bacterium]|nr:DUF1778 domain-containing protein [Pyrinomonadaceae bacterium]
MAVNVLPKSKTSNIHIRVPDEIKRRIERAISISGQSMTDFATRSLVESADAIIEKEEITILTARDHEILMAMLEADDEPTEELREAARLHRQFVRR